MHHFTCCRPLAGMYNTIRTPSVSADKGLKIEYQLRPEINISLDKKCNNGHAHKPLTEYFSDVYQLFNILR